MALASLESAKLPHAQGHRRLRVLNQLFEVLPQSFQGSRYHKLGGVFLGERRSSETFPTRIMAGTPPRPMLS